MEQMIKNKDQEDDYKNGRKNKNKNQANENYKERKNRRKKLNTEGRKGRWLINWKKMQVWNEQKFSNKR